MLELIKDLIIKAGYLLDTEDYKCGLFFHRDGGFLNPDGVSILLDDRRYLFSIADPRGGKKASEMWFDHKYPEQTIKDYKIIKQMLNEH